MILIGMMLTRFRSTDKYQGGERIRAWQPFAFLMIDQDL